MENFEAMYRMGNKANKYMNYQTKQAPLLNRGSTHHSQQFCVKPLGDHLCNRELSEAFARTPNLPVEADIGSATSYAENFNIPRTKEHFAFCKTTDQGPPRKTRTHTLTCNEETMVKTSKSQTEHVAKPFHLARQEICTPKNNFLLGGMPVGDTYRTHYGSEYGKPMASSAGLENLFAELKKKRQPVKEEHLMFTIRRSPFLSPGM